MRSCIGSGVLAAVLLATGLTPAASDASVGGKDLFLASVGSGPGVAPSVWYTTVWVFNPNTTAVTAQFSLLLRNQANDFPSNASRVVQPGAVLQIDDAVTTLFSVQGFGAIRVQADKDLHVVARIYSKAAGKGDRDSVGQFFAAVPASLAIGLGQTADLLGVTKVAGGDFRYNVGFVETTGNQGVFQIQVWTDTGGAWATSAVTLMPFEQKQLAIGDLLQSFGDAANFRLRFVGTIGTGRAIVFGSRIANGSQDPTTFEMALPASVLAPTAAAP